MTANHFSPKLNKKRFLTHGEFTVYTVNAFAVRNVAQPDEEFGNFATVDDFPDLIAKGEIWISEKLAAKEGIFFVANALTQLHQQGRGVSDDKAYDQGIEAERMLREAINGITFRDGKPHQRVPEEIYLEPYDALPDREGPVKVWLIDGNLARSYYKIDYTEGGHGYVYPWVPRREIWIEDGVDRRELPFIVSHEYLESRLMRDEGIDYDTAHGICARVEFHLRKRRGAHPLLVHGRRKLRKTDLARLTADAILQFVMEHYVKRGS